VLPPERLAERLADLSVVTPVLDGSSASISPCVAVTLEHRDSFLAHQWVHSIRASVDRFPDDSTTTSRTSSKRVRRVDAGEDRVNRVR
jgi:hypothetical protein